MTSQAQTVDKEQPDQKLGENVSDCYRAEGHNWVGNEQLSVCINCGETKKE